MENSSLDIKFSSGFNLWLYEQNISLIFTTYQIGKVFLIGLQSNGRLSIFERTFNRCMGLWVEESSLYISSLYQLWRFENILEKGKSYQGYDRVYLPQIGYVTGDLDIHDLVISNQKIVFVNTLFSCLSTVSEKASFKALWRPHFISKLAAEDRCHLNGLALKDGQIKYVSAVSQSDVAEGWREHRDNGGCVIDVENNQVIVQNLSMPHSPRWYQNKLWILNSGTGEFGYINLKSGVFEPIVFCPGYLRGCAFIGDFALIGLSKPRKNKTFSGLMLDESLQSHNLSAFCGLLIVDIKQGKIIHWFRFDSIVEELYDVGVLSGVKRPMMIGLKSDEILRFITIE